VSERPRALVVGAGIAGLAAAVDLVDDGRFDVEVREAGDRPGGKIRTSAFAGIAHVDEAADAYLVRVPHAVALAAKVGVGDTTAPTGARAMIWNDGMHEIPSEVLLGVPAAVLPFARSSLLSWRGKLRAALEPLLPRTDPHDSIGRLIRARFGDEVHDRLVDALVGSIYAADTDRSSLQAVPQLAGLAQQHRSLLLGGRSARARQGATSRGPIFGAPRAGMGGLVAAAADHVERHGGTILVHRPVASIERDGAGWRVDDERFDVVVLATPAPAAAPLLTAVAPDAAAGLATIEQADVIMLRLAVPADNLPDAIVHGHSGYLVPKSRQRFVTAASFASQKWAHWQPDDGGHLLRVSIGRDGLPIDHLDDAAAVDAVVADTEVHLGVTLQPDAVSVTRWLGAFPQYRPYHHRLVDQVEAAMPTGIALAGASYRGIGIPACVADGRRAALQVSTWHAEELLR
jgi:protoporphyrinogen/coproporphyrinogen III oxidase